MYRWVVEASTYVREANSNKGREAESNVIRNILSHQQVSRAENNLYAL